jgi:predicted aldo/keto reductase-like oxidoreductase
MSTEDPAVYGLGPEIIGKRKMRYRKFGHTGKEVSVLGFGGMRFDPKDEARAVQTIQRAAELGINYFDTAPGYCEDRSETIIGKALAQLPASLREGVFVSTKSHFTADPKADDVRRRIEGQLEKLQRDKIDFYQMWCIMDLKQFKAIMEPGGPYDGALQAKNEGLIEHICFSAHASGEDIATVIEAGVFAGVTLGYNILNYHYRQQGLKAAAEAGIGVVTMNPLGGGMLTRNAEELKVLQEDGSDSYVEAALRFNLSHPEINVVLPGMKDLDEVESNVETAESVKGPDPETVARMLRNCKSLGETFCTTCGYCLEHCPEKIQIHLYAGLWDRVRMQLPEEAYRVYKFYLGNEERWFKGKRATDCTQCGECELFCTQKLPIREYLQKIADFLDE